VGSLALVCYSYTVKVVTKNGVEASYTFVWP